MYTFHRAILSVVPEFYNHAFSISDKDVMCQLFESIFAQKYNRELEFNTGAANNSVSSIIRLENNDFLMNYRQLNIKNIWGLLTDDVYDDILLLEVDNSLPYTINGTAHQAVAVIESNTFVPIESISSGYVRYNGKVYKASDLKIQERYVLNDYKIFAIAPFHNCTVIDKNDGVLCEMQSIDKVCDKDIYGLKKKIHMNREYDISIRL